MQLSKNDKHEVLEKDSSFAGIDSADMSFPNIYRYNSPKDKKLGLIDKLAESFEDKREKNKKSTGANQRLTPVLFYLI